MADNITLPGVGALVSTDEITRATIVQHAQLFKLMLGAESSYSGMLDYGQATMAASLPVVIANNQSAIPVSGSLTVSGSVTANAGTNLNTSLLALESGGNIALIKAKTDNIPALGQALAAASVPVVLTAAQITTLTPLSTVAATQSGTWNITNVSGTVSLPTGASTSANQSTEIARLDTLILATDTLEASFTTLNAKDFATQTTLSALNTKVTACNTGAVVVSSSALPTGAATSALQTQPGVDIGDVTINNAAGASAVNIQDGGNSITVDGSVSATVSGTVTANIGTISTIATEATLSTLNGKVTACNTGAVTISAALPAGTNAIGKLAANSGVDIGDVDVTSITLPTGSATLSDSSQNVTTAGTRVQLTGAACKKIIITAKAANTGTIWVGGSTIAANRGIPLVALQNITLEVSNVNVVYIDSTVNGEGITYAYLS